MSKQILAVDPGESAGWFIVNTIAPKEITSVGQSTPLELVNWLHGALGLFDEVVCEHFVIGAGTHRKSSGSAIYRTLNVEGWLVLECQRRGIPITLQTPEGARLFAGEKDEKLKHLGWYSLGQLRGNRDARSAARHMLKYLVDHGQLTGRDLM